MPIRPSPVKGPDPAKTAKQQGYSRIRPPSWGELPIIDSPARRPAGQDAPATRLSHGPTSDNHEHHVNANWRPDVVRAKLSRARALGARVSLMPMAITARLSLDWTKWRAEFPILSRKTYLNSCSLGALSHRAEARVAQFHEDWHNFGASAWYETWMSRIGDLRGRVARMVNAAPEEIAFAHSTSSALASVASAVDYSRRNRVVVAELDFPTVSYQWLVRPGVEVVRVPSDNGSTIDLERFAQAIDDRTAVVATGHVFYATGAIQDVARIAELARAKGALSVIDGYQAIGQVPVDVKALGVDVYACGPLKWLLGGPGLCYLYVRK